MSSLVRQGDMNITAECEKRATLSVVVWRTGGCGWQRRGVARVINSDNLNMIISCE